MRALLINPAFPKLFWSMQRLCRIQDCQASTVPLGLITVAALLPPHWQLRLVDLNTGPLTPSDWEWAEVVLITSMGIQRPNFLKLVRQAKALGKTVIAGGPQPSVMPEEVMALGCDFLVRGEAELLMDRVLADLKQGKSGIIYEATEKPDLSLSPVPRFDLLNPKDYLSMAIQTTRGCPFDCEFCDVVSLFGRKVRTKKPEQVLAELEAIHRLGGVEEIFIADDNFIGNKAFARELLHKLIPWMKERGEPFCFMTQTSVNLGQEPELIDLMTEANFGTVFIGVESPDEAVLQQAHKRQNVAGSLADSLRTINANGLSIIGSFILGLDGETPGTGDRIIDFVEDTNIPIVMLNMLFPLAKTRLWQRLEKEGRLRDELVEGWVFQNFPEMDYYCRMFFQPSRPEEEILAEFFRMIDRLYEPSAYLGRAYRSILAMRPTRAATAAKKGKPPAPAGPSHQKSWGNYFNDVRRFLRLSWALGVKGSARGQFWRQLYGVWKYNPSRLMRYVRICAWGEDFFLFRDAMRRHKEQIKGAEKEPQLAPATS